MYSAAPGAENSGRTETKQAPGSLPPRASREIQRATAVDSRSAQNAAVASAWSARAQGRRRQSEAGRNRRVDLGEVGQRDDGGGDGENADEASRRDAEQGGSREDQEARQASGRALHGEADRLRGTGMPRGATPAGRSPMRRSAATRRWGWRRRRRRSCRAVARTRSRTAAARSRAPAWRSRRGRESGPSQSKGAVARRRGSLGSARLPVARRPASLQETSDAVGEAREDSEDVAAVKVRPQPLQAGEQRDRAPAEGAAPLQQDQRDDEQQAAHELGPRREAVDGRGERQRRDRSVGEAEAIEIRPGEDQRHQGRRRTASRRPRRTRAPGSGSAARGSPSTARSA